MNEPNTLSPTPWDIGHFESGLLEGVHFVGDANGKIVASLGSSFSEADGNVLAASPDLLAALEAIVAFDTPLPHGLLEQARAAIAKAKGTP